MKSFQLLFLMTLALLALGKVSADDSTPQSVTFPDADDSSISTTTTTPIDNPTATSNATSIDTSSTETSTSIAATTTITTTTPTSATFSITNSADLQILPRPAPLLTVGAVIVIDDTQQFTVTSTNDTAAPALLSLQNLDGQWILSSQTLTQLTPEIADANVTLLVDSTGQNQTDPSLLTSTPSLLNWTIFVNDRSFVVESATGYQLVKDAASGQTYQMTMNDQSLVTFTKVFNYNSIKYTDAAQSHALSLSLVNATVSIANSSQTFSLLDMTADFTYDVKNGDSTASVTLSSDLGTITVPQSLVTGTVDSTTTTTTTTTPTPTSATFNITNSADLQILPRPAPLLTVGAVIVIDDTQQFTVTSTNDTAAPALLSLQNLDGQWILSSQTLTQLTPEIADANVTLLVDSTGQNQTDPSLLTSTPSLLNWTIFVNDRSFVVESATGYQLVKDAASGQTYQMTMNDQSLVTFTKVFNYNSIKYTDAAQSHALSLSLVNATVSIPSGQTFTLLDMTANFTYDVQNGDSTASVTLSSDLSTITVPQSLVQSVLITSTPHLGLKIQQTTSTSTSTTSTSTTSTSTTSTPSPSPVSQGSDTGTANATLTSNSTPVSSTANETMTSSSIQSTTSVSEGPGPVTPISTSSIDLPSNTAALIATTSPTNSGGEVLTQQSVDSEGTKNTTVLAIVDANNQTVSLNPNTSSVALINSTIVTDSGNFKITGTTNSSNTFSAVDDTGKAVTVKFDSNGHLQINPVDTVDQTSDSDVQGLTTQIAPADSSPILGVALVATALVAVAGIGVIQYRRVNAISLKKSSPEKQVDPESPQLEEPNLHSELSLASELPRVSSEANQLSMPNLAAIPSNVFSYYLSETSSSQVNLASGVSSNSELPIRRTSAQQSPIAENGPEATSKLFVPAQEGGALSTVFSYYSSQEADSRVHSIIVPESGAQTPYSIRQSQLPPAKVLSTLLREHQQLPAESSVELSNMMADMLMSAPPSVLSDGQARNSVSESVRSSFIAPLPQSPMSPVMSSQPIQSIQSRVTMNSSVPIREPTRIFAVDTSNLAVSAFFQNSPNRSILLDKVDENESVEQVNGPVETPEVTSTEDIIADETNLTEQDQEIAKDVRTWI